MQALDSIFLTGGSGFLGKAFLRSVPAGISVLAMTRKEPPQSPVETGIRWCEGSLPDALPDHLPPTGPLCVVHLAAEKRDASLMEGINIQGTRAMLHWARDQGASYFVHMSSVGTYGARGRLTVRPGHEERPNNPYERTKQAAEQLVRDLAAEYGLSYAIVQPSNVIGWKDGGPYPLLTLMRSIKSRRFAWIGNPDHAWFNYIHVEDVASALWAVVADPGMFNGRTFILNTPVTMREAIETIADEMGQAAPRRSLPISAAFAVGALGSGLEALLGRRLPVNKARVSELTCPTYYDGQDIETVGEFRYPLGIRKGLRMLVRAYIDRGLL